MLITVYYNDTYQHSTTITNIKYLVISMQSQSTSSSSCARAIVNRDIRYTGLAIFGAKNNFEFDVIFIILICNCIEVALCTCIYKCKVAYTSRLEQTETITYQFKLKYLTL